MVDCGMVDGKRIRYAYATKEEAEGEAALLRVQRRNEGNSSFILSKFDAVDAEAAWKILKPHGITLREAAQFYLENINIVREPKAVAAVVAELLKAKAQDGRSKRYLKDLRLKLQNGFAGEFGDRAIHEISHQELDDWLRGHEEWSALTRNNYNAALGVLFGFALRRGYLLKDPTDRLDRASVTLEKPGILSVAECRTLLAAAPDDFKAPVALGLFAGLRPEAELWHLDWHAIDFKERLIDISVSKNSASHRFVKIADNLAAWLKPYRQDSGPVSPKGDAYHSRLQKARETAAQELDRVNLPSPALDDWPQDALRHTFASMHYAHFKHAAETAEQMGHAGGLRIFFRHYRNRVKPAEARAFWRLVPSAAA
jgi:integrase